MKLIFSRFGGKKRKANEIIEHFPEHKIYVEPFLGSGAIFITKTKSEINVLNDLDPAIYNIFSNVEEYGSQFDNQEWDWTPDRDKWIELKSSLQERGNLGPTSLYESIYHLRNSWSGLGTSFTPNRFKNNEYLVKLSNYKDLMKDTIVLQKDYKEVIEFCDDPDAFFYLDPPYEVALKKNYYEYQTGFSLEEMRDLLRGMKGKFLLSLDVTPYITDLFKEFKMDTIEFKYCCSGKYKFKTEYLIKNY